MSSTTENLPVPDFEIDHRDEYAQFFLNAPQEISFHLNLLAKRGKLLSAHLDDGKLFFLTALVVVDAERKSLLFDTAQAEAINQAALAARQVTFSASLDGIKIQFRLPGLQEQNHEGRRVLSGTIPASVLRLQRREYFRLAPPLSRPLACQIHLGSQDAHSTIVACGVADISGGGISLTAPMTHREAYQRDNLLLNSRLEIPDEGVLLINLRVRKTVELSTEDQQHHLRIGCEFVGLPSGRLAMIERYITRIERERTAKISGLAD